MAHDPTLARALQAPIADVYLVPQVESARRFNVDLSAYPNIVAVDAACNELEAFRKATPAVQPDAPAQTTKP